MRGKSDMDIGIFEVGMDGSIARAVLLAFERYKTRNIPEELKDLRRIFVGVYSYPDKIQVRFAESAPGENEEFSATRYNGVYDVRLSDFTVVVR
jgi:hypothetical protein